jgi:hypothetical protein
LAREELGALEATEVELMAAAQALALFYLLAVAAVGTAVPLVVAAAAG